MLKNVLKKRRVLRRFCIEHVKNAKKRHFNKGTYSYNRI